MGINNYKNLTLPIDKPLFLSDEVDYKKFKRTQLIEILRFCDLKVVLSSSKKELMEMFENEILENIDIYRKLFKERAVEEKIESEKFDVTEKKRSKKSEKIKEPKKIKENIKKETKKEDEVKTKDLKKIKVSKKIEDSEKILEEDSNIVTNTSFLRFRASAIKRNEIKKKSKKKIENPVESYKVFNLTPRTQKATKILISTPKNILDESPKDLEKGFLKKNFLIISIFFVNIFTFLIISKSFKVLDFLYLEYRNVQKIRNFIVFLNNFASSNFFKILYCLSLVFFFCFFYLHYECRLNYYFVLESCLKEYPLHFVYLNEFEDYFCVYPGFLKKIVWKYFKNLYINLKKGENYKIKFKVDNENRIICLFEDSNDVEE